MGNKGRTGGSVAGFDMNDLSSRFYRLFSGAWRRRYALVTPILLLPLMGLFFANFSAQRYTAHTSLLIQETANMNPFLEDFAVSAMLKERMATMETLLHSRHILAKVATQRGLIDQQTSATKRDQIVQQLSSSLRVSMPSKDLIRIDFASNKPETMEQTLVSVSDQFIQQLLAPERSSMEDSTLFLEQQLEQRRMDIEVAEQKLADFKGRYAADLPELHVGNISRYTQLKQQLAEKMAEMAGASKSLGGLDAQLSKTNPVIGRLEEQIVKLNGDLALLRSRYTDRHSKIQAVLRKLHSLEAERQNNLKNNQQNIDTTKLWQIASNAESSGFDKTQQPLLISQLQSLQKSRNNVEGLEEEIKSLKTMISELEESLSGYGELESALTKLERDQKVKRELYDELLNRYEMARITGSLSLFEQSKRVKIIDEPYTPTSPSNFPVLIFVLAGLVGGIFMGASLAILLELSDNSVRYRSQLETITNLPVFGRIPAY
jgi:polysaccharide chain length determinant protein (PEP-CTERM system associated)